MSQPVCSRKWQVEAARDGRLRGKDLESVRRHWLTCAECAAEERALAALQAQLVALPELTRDPLTAQRTRHDLLAAINESLIAPRATRPLWRSALVFVLVPGLCFAAIGLTWLTVHRAPPSSQSASAPPAAPLIASSVPALSAELDPAPIPGTGASAPAPAIRSSAASIGSQRARRASDESSSKAEDDAYLRIVELLREGKNREARTLANSYLQRFPNGFRRAEVSNIAAREP